MSISSTNGQGRLRANIISTEQGQKFETPSGKINVTPSGKTSRLTVQTGTARSTPSGKNYFNTLVNTNVNEYLYLSNNRHFVTTIQGDIITGANWTAMLHIYLIRYM